MTPKISGSDRRGFIVDGLRVAGAMSVAGLVGFLTGRRGQAQRMVWQIDPNRCIACGNCATYCVLYGVQKESAVKCVHNFGMCGYCTMCTGHMAKVRYADNTGAENELCPAGHHPPGYSGERNLTRVHDQ